MLAEACSPTATSHALAPWRVKTAPSVRIVAVRKQAALSTTQRPCSILNALLARAATKLRGYKAWMERDDRIVGLNGYHWKDDGRRSANGTWLPRGDAWLGLGVKSLPRTQAVLAELAGAAGRSR
jgi:hypothetical protein